MIFCLSCGGGSDSGFPVMPWASPINNDGGYRLVGGIETTCSEDMVVFGHILYIADGPSGLRVVDISKPAYPALMKTIPTTYAYRVYVYENTLYLCDGPAGIKVYSLTSPANPQLTYYDDTEWATSIAFRDGLLFLGDYFAGFRIYDVAVPGTPVLVRTVNVSRVRDLVFEGDALLVSDAPYGLSTFYFNNRTSPFCTYTDGSVNSNYEDIVASGNFAIVARNDESSKIRVFAIKGRVKVDLSNESYPARFIEGLTSWSDKLFVSCGEDGVISYDMSALPKLTAEFQINTSGYARRVKCENTYIFVADMSSVAIYGANVSANSQITPVNEPVIPGNLHNSVLPEYAGYQVRYGDPHVHTSYSDGDESPDFALRYARDASQLDWCCITDHSEIMSDDGNVAVNYYRSLPSKYDRKGDFCVLFGYEWTSNFHGHRNVYSLNSQIPILPSNQDATCSTDTLWGGLAAYDVITVPHHPMMSSMYHWWLYKNPEVEPCVEIYSKWGLSLIRGNPRPLDDARPSNGIYRAMIGEGTRYGFMGGTDTHMSRPGSRLEESRQEQALPYAQPGLTGVWVPSFTREEIFNALKNRHCYAMTGTRVNLQTTVNGAIMGSEITSSTSPVIEFYASAPINISLVVVVRLDNNSTTNIATFYPNSTEFSATWTDAAINWSACYFVRVVLENSDMAMSSPVWVGRTG